MSNYNSNKTPWENYKKTIQSVALEEGVESIGMCALSECKELKGVSIMPSITTIYSNQFAVCTKLARIEVSENNSNYSTMNEV